MTKKTSNKRQVKKIDKVTQPNTKPDLIPKEDLPFTQAKKGLFLPKITPMNFSNIAMGQGQDIPTAPLNVPNGFTTQIPYTSAINSTILANPSPIPITSCYHVLTTDPVVYSAMLYLTTSIISRIGEYNNPQDEDAQKLVRSTLQRIGKKKLLRGMLTKLWAGFALIKLNWDIIDGITAIRSISILPPNSILMAATPEGELDPEFGTMQYYYNINSGWQQNPYGFGGNTPAEYSRYGSMLVPTRQLTYNPMYITAIPEEWRILDVFNPVGMEGNYYGNSLINSIWSSVASKNNQIMKLEIATTYKASPMVFFQTDTQTQVQDGSRFISKAEELQQNLPLAAQTGYYISESKDAVEITTIDNTADLDKILSTIYAFNDQIRTGLVTPNLVGNSGSYANAMANNEANRDIINNLTEDIIDVLMCQLVVPIIRYGKDEDATEFGYFELLDNSIEDKTLWAKICETAKNMGVIDPNSLDDVNFIRKKVGLPPLNDLSEDIIMGMMSDMQMMGKGVNMGKAKQSIKQPYANGGVKEIKKDQYGT